MKSLINKFLIVLALMFGVTATAQAEDLWGCEVMLCLSNPGGPTQFNECKPPIQKLWKHLAKGHSFPSCSQANGNDPAKNFVRQTVDAYDPCHLKGLKDAPIGYVAEGTRKTNTTKTKGFGFGQGETSRNYTLTKSPGYNTGGRTFAQNGQGMATTKMCVGNQTGGYTVRVDRGTSYNVIVFDKVLQQKAQSPNALDVYVDGNLFNRVHW